MITGLQVEGNCDAGNLLRDFWGSGLSGEPVEFSGMTA
jgi:hypothetical protein